MRSYIEQYYVHIKKKKVSYFSTGNIVLIYSKFHLPTCFLFTDYNLCVNITLLLYSQFDYQLLISQTDHVILPLLSRKNMCQKSLF